MCTRINQKDLTTVHHEMGHIEYFLAYKNQPTVFRSGANPGFHEAIGDTISLSVETPSYLKRVGLMNQSELNSGNLFIIFKIEYNKCHTFIILILITYSLF